MDNCSMYEGKQMIQQRNRYKNYFHSILMVISFHHDIKGFPLLAKICSEHLCSVGGVFRLFVLIYEESNNDDHQWTR